MHEGRRLLLEQIIGHINIIEERFTYIQKQDDFINTNDGKVLLDAITMRLQALSDNAKTLAKKFPEVIKNFPEVDWKEIIHFRDFISHHYELLDYQVIFSICKYDLPVLKATIKKILDNPSL